MDITNKILEIRSFLNKQAFPHGISLKGTPMDLNIENLKEDQRLNYLDNYIKGVFAKDGVYFNDLDPEDKNSIQGYYDNLKKKNYLI